MKKSKDEATETTKYAVGEVIEWQSQASGSWTKKKGPILCVLPGSKRLSEKLTELGHTLPKSRVKATDRVLGARYVVAVQAARKKDPALLIYAPLVKVIDGKSAGAGKVVRDTTR